MGINRRDIYDLISQTALFNHLEESVLDRLVDLFSLTTYRQGEVIFDIGDASEVMFIIWDGKVVLTSDWGDPLGRLRRGDFMGEEALLYDDPRFYSAVAETDVVVVWMSAEGFLTLSNQMPGVEEKLEIDISSRRLSLQVDLPWLQQDEFVRIITRRHPAILWLRALAPVGLLIFTLLFSLLFLLLWLPGSLFGWFLLIIGVVIGSAWLVWRIIDWHNDYFIVTNKRVVWIEKVSLIYESRQEAPLRTIMSIGMQQSWFGRVVGFADVLVMTYVGTIRLGDIEHAEVFGNLIESYWHHSKFDERYQESQMIAEKLHEKLGFPQMDEDKNLSSQAASEGGPEEMVSVTQSPDGQISSVQVKEPGFFTWLFSDFIRLRYETGGEIVYRKHWFVLIKRTWLPVLISVFGLVALVMRVVGSITIFSLSTGAALLLLVLIFCLVWIVYQYADWRNDIFKVTWDQVIDLDRKPLGKVHRRSAPLENILSIEYERLGFWGFLFNFGTVFISVGNSQLTFDHVYNPSEVQQDIFYRMGERLDRVQQFQIDAERERMSEWIASYHRRNEVLRKRNQHDADQA